VFSPGDYPDDTVRLAGPAAGDPIAWSADGSRLLVRKPSSASIDGRQGLFVLDPDGTETRVAPDSVSGFGGASISPDGTQVVYAVGFEPSRLELAVVGGGTTPVVLRNSDVTLGRPAFSPDGGRIAYIEGSYDHSNALWVMNADGSNRRQVAGGDWYHVRALVWSPDGERLAISCGCPAGSGVYTIRADGSALTLVSADEDEERTTPQWSPDGSQIALVHANNDVIAPGQPTTATLVVVGAEGGEERQLVHFELALLDEENPRLLTIAWNPTG
jgi:Tol biopolymer transport system component